MTCARRCRRFWVGRESCARGSTREDIERGLEIIERNATLQAQLIEDLFDMSRILSNKLDLDLQPGVDLASVIHAAIQSIQPEAEAKGVVIRSVIPPGAAPHMTGDARRLQQVMWNLLSQAVKVTPQGGEVDIALEARAQEVEIRIRDTGSGIAPELISLVFDRFRQQDLAAIRPYSGLGLAIARQLVDTHGGSIRVSSAGEGRGATFSVILPAEPEASAAPRPALGRTGHTTPARTHDERILVLDDEVELRDLMVRFLSREGYAVCSAETIREAVQRAPEFQPTLLVVDWLLKNGQNGGDAVRALRAVMPNLKAIVMSGLPPEQVRIQLGEIEVLDVLEKPFAVGALIEQLQRALP